MGRKFYVTTLRLISGHGLYPAFLYKLDILPKPMYRCNEDEGTLNNVRFACGNHKIKAHALIPRVKI